MIPPYYRWVVLCTVKNLGSTLSMYFHIGQYNLAFQLLFLSQSRPCDDIWLCISTKLVQKVHITLRSFIYSVFTFRTTIRYDPKNTRLYVDGEFPST
jgi:hypothetical protein